MARRFRDQAAACANLGSPMYAALLERVAGDIEAGGVTRSVLAGHEEDPGPSALALRLAGSVHRLVLSGDADELAAYYPSAGGVWDPEAGWEAFRRLLRDHADRVREWLDRPPQTNEVGRAAALMGGLLQIGEVVDHPVRLFEIGSSGGLNLNADRFAYTDQDDRVFGDETARLVLRRAWQGRPLRPWPNLRITERLGSDYRPVDVATAEGRLTLSSYVWPDQTERLDRLREAFAVAAEHPVEVRRTDARSFVDDLALADGATTVLWHSVMWQYLPPEDRDAIRDRIEALGASATESRVFAHLLLEPLRRTPGSEHEFLAVLEVWPGGERRILGTAPGHGVPVTWE